MSYMFIHMRAEQYFQILPIIFLIQLGPMYIVSNMESKQFAHRSDYYTTYTFILFVLYQT